MKYRLGLDLGTNSIGFAVLELQESTPYKIIDAGVRIFSDGRDPKSKESLAVARRVARGARRRRDRALSRKKTLMNFLVAINLMPTDKTARKELELLEPYELRSKAVLQAIEPFELGRAIFHLAQRRGFKSNRKEIINNPITEEDSEKNKKEKAVDKISDQEKRDNLQSEIAKHNCQTLGEYLFKHRLNKGLNARALADYDVLYPTRQMYLDEFLTIKKFQQQHQNISEESWQKIENIIFFQRKLKAQDRGECSFLNSYNINENNLPQWALSLLAEKSNNSVNFKGLPRAYLAMPSYCLFRILSEVNNLKLKNIVTRESIELSCEQKQKIINKLNSQKSPVKFSTLKKELSTKETNYQHNYEFNLESENRTELNANPTLNLMANEKYFGNLWQQLSLADQDDIIEFLLTADEEQDVKQQALSQWQVSPQQAENLSKLTINHFQNTAIGNMCKEIVQKLCQVMQQNYCRYDEALKSLGIDHSNQQYGDGTADFLPYYALAMPVSVVKVNSPSAPKEEQEHGKIANPTVHIALNQIRKVTNDIIKNYGKPAEIHIELARELKQTKKQKKQTEKQQRINKKENDEAKKVLAEQGVIDNYENRLRYKLWKELNFKDVNERKCPYSGKQICIAKLFSAEFEIEHILPFSQTFDDSIANKTLASKSANAIKGNRSPFDAFASSSVYNYQEILQRTQVMPKNKKWRFEPEAMQKFSDQNSFIASQLNDTRYISKVTKQYFQQICDQIRIGNGRITALLRHNWGLNSLLHNEETSQTTQDFDAETGEVLNDSSSQNQDSAKNRQDHRHHAIDAICIAMTDHKIFKQISTDNARNCNLDRLSINLPSHWNAFREDVAKTIAKIIVSHKNDHSKNVKLHDETNYGKLNQPVLVSSNKKQPAECNLVVATKLTALKKADVYYVCDAKLKKLLLAEAEKATSDKDFQEKILPAFSKNTGIKKVRLFDNNKSVIEISHPATTRHLTKVVKTNGNHHIALWQMPDGTYTTDVVSNFKANCPYEILTREDGFQYINYNKKFSKEQELEKFKPHPAAKLIIRLFKDDLVRIEEDGNIKTVVIKIIGSNTRCFYLPHNIASGENGSFRLNLKALQTKKIRKLFVSPSGKIYDNGPIINNINSNK